LFSIAITAMAAARIFGFWFATRTVKFMKGEVWHVHTMLFSASPTHHNSGPPGTIIDNPDESAVTALSKAAAVTANARRKCTIFLSGEVYAGAKEDKGNKERQ